MAYSVVVAPLVLQRLDGAAAYLAEHHASPRSIEGLLSEFDSAIRALETFPGAYPMSEEASKAVGIPLRKVRVGSYLLFYQVLEEEHLVRAVTLLHARQDLPSRIVADFSSERL